MPESKPHDLARSIGMTFHSCAYLLLVGLLLSAGLILVPTAGLSSTTDLSSPTTDPITVVFLDDFEDGVLDRWAVDPTWSIEDDGGDLVLHGQVPAGGWAGATVQDRTFGDFTARAQLKLLEGDASLFFRRYHDGLFQSLDGGDTWSHMADTGSDHLHGLTVDPVNPDVAYVGSVGGTGEYSAPYSTIYKTTDGGASWTEINNGFPLTATSVHAIAIDPANTDTVYVGTYREGLFHTEGSGIGIYKSTDGGGSWRPVNQGLTTLNVTALAVDPFNPQTVYAGTDRGLFVTANGGGEWTLVSGALTNVQINAIVPDPTAPGALYITTGWAGVLRTTDGGVSWVSLNQGLPLPLLPIGDLILDPARGVFYVAVRGAGVYQGALQPAWEIYLPLILKGG